MRGAFRTTAVITVAGGVLLATLGAGALAPISAQTTDDHVKRAMGEVAGELEVCSAYFMVVSTCVKPQEPRLARDYEADGKRIGGISFMLFQSLGVSEAAVAAQYKLYTDAMMNAMQQNCTNIAVLLQRYRNFCQRLSQDADPRLKEWIACSSARQRSCGGPGLP
jgi:hypothetical protein